MSDGQPFIEAPPLMDKPRARAVGPAEAAAILDRGQPRDPDMEAVAIRKAAEKARALAGAVKPGPPAKACAKCGKPVELARNCYAVPVCYACLPPPEPLPVTAARQPDSPLAECSQSADNAMQELKVEAQKAWDNRLVAFTKELGRVAFMLPGGRYAIPYHQARVTPTAVFLFLPLGPQYASFVPTPGDSLQLDLGNGQPLIEVMYLGGYIELPELGMAVLHLQRPLA